MLKSTEKKIDEKPKRIAKYWLIFPLIWIFSVSPESIWSHYRLYESSIFFFIRKESHVAKLNVTPLEKVCRWPTNKIFPMHSLVFQSSKIKHFILCFTILHDVIEIEDISNQLILNLFDEFQSSKMGHSG